VKSKLTRRQAALVAHCSASLWAVCFETKEGMFHPVRYGKAGGMKYSREEIAGAAELYLKKESSWLKCVDEIRPLDETPNKGVKQ